MTPTFNKLKKPELLAPGGDLRRAKLAIDYGADAVYIGGMAYSLRARASNFGIPEIHEICEYAHARNARIHVTVNIIPHEEDFVGIKEYLQELEKAGVDAIITASIAIMKIAKEYTSLKIHGSTQMSVTNEVTANYLHSQIGLERIVLARECTIEEVKNITQHCDIETETFIHGGMCINYSGRCTLSNRMCDRDANRGGCAQSCRWQYALFDGDELVSDSEFTLGAKDMMAANHMYDFMEAGVSSLKIEGRMKSEYYVASIVSGYRKLIDDLYEAQRPFTKEELQPYIDMIMKGENREVWDGMYGGDPLQDGILYYVNSNAHVNHDFIGIVDSYADGYMTITTRNAFNVGDKIEVMRKRKPTYALTVTEIIDHKGNNLERSKVPMSKVKVPIDIAVDKDDMVRLIHDTH